MSNTVYSGYSYFTHTSHNAATEYRSKTPGKAAAPGHFRGLVFQLDIGVVQRGGSGWGGRWR